MIFNLIKQAKQMLFDNSVSGLGAKNVQDAIDEVNSNLSALGNYTLLNGSSYLIGSSTSINLAQDISNFRYIVFMFAFSDSKQSVTPIMIPVDLFVYGFSANYSFIGNSSNSCWASAIFKSATSVTIVGASDGYTPYLVGVYGIK